MPLANCPRCKKMFNKTESLVCSACEPAEQADYKKARVVLEENPGLNAEQLAEMADVAIAVVQRMLKDGILAHKREGVGMLCSSCGVNAATHVVRRLCQECLDKLNMDMAKAQASIKQNMQPTRETVDNASVRKAFEERTRR